MSFLTLTNMHVQLNARSLNCGSYSIAKTLLTARPVKLIDKHKFAKAAFNENSKTFFVHVAALKPS